MCGGAGEDKMPERVFTDTDALAALCRRHAIIRVSLFGSVLKGTAGPASDVDLLLEFMPGSTPGLMALTAIEAEFSDLLGGRRVDLRTTADLSRHFRDDVISTAALQYAA
jgi:predicted nucleotidyltransferase